MRIYERNMQFLKKKVPNIWAQLRDMEVNAFQILQGPKGTEYIQGVGQDNQTVTIHSKYDPIREAKSIIDTHQEQIEAHEYILFVGVGLGYHIQYFIESYPNKNVYLYDPSLEIFSLFMQRLKVEDFFGLYIGNIADNLERLKIEVFNRKIHMITLPVYEKTFKDECTILYDKQLEFWKEKKTEVLVEARFEKQWIYNSLHNYHQILKDTSILHSTFKTFFQGKSVVLVSAGPSLDDEIENLRLIKENKLAYIFSVGSAIQTLLKHEIIPDAACSYDPGYNNMETYERVLNEGIDSIPLFYASTLTSDLVEQWPGQRGYFLLSQDGLNPQFFCREEDEIIFDAPTVAVILLQIVLRWNVGKIILVGQNLALRDKKSYSEAISYYQEVNKQEVAKDELIEVKSVEGKVIYTKDIYKKMKDSLENCIRGYNRLDVINATQGGAHIEGTVFLSLEQVIQEFLTKETVEENWFLKVVSKVLEKEREERSNSVKEKVDKFLQEKERFQKDFQSVKKNIEEIESALKHKKLKQVERYFEKYDRAMTRVESNLYYKGLIIPFIQVFLKQESKKVQEIMMRKQTDIEREQQKLELVKRVTDLITPVNQWMIEEITSLDFKGEKNYELY